jgi:tRNA(Ile)-lysidine synthase
MPDDPWIRQALLLRHIRRLDPEARDVSAADLERLAGTNERTSVTKSLELLRDNDQIVLRRRDQRATPQFEIEIDAGNEVYIPEIETIVRIYPATNDGNNQRIQLPKGAKKHFTVRNRRDGDRFRPLGMAHDKKLKDFLIDRKIAATSRDRIPLLLWNDTIVWVAGVEVSELFKVTGETADLCEVAIEQTHQGVRRSRD